MMPSSALPTATDVTVSAKANRTADALRMKRADMGDSFVWSGTRCANASRHGNIASVSFRGRRAIRGPANAGLGQEIVDGSEQTCPTPTPHPSPQGGGEHTGARCSIDLPLDVTRHYRLTLRRAPLSLVGRGS